MPSMQELPPIDPERRQAVADWVSQNVQPAMHQAIESAQAEGQPRQEFELRDYQVDAWVRLEQARASGNIRALGNLAMGLGKTFVTAVDVMRYREWCAAQDPPMYPRTLYVSHRNSIDEQAAKTYATVMPDAKIEFFRTRRRHLPDADVTFATIQSLYSQLDRFDPQDFEYIVWDESHHLEAETFRVVRDYFDPLFEQAITATLERMDGRDIQEYFGIPLYQKTLSEGIAEGHLVDVDYHIVFDKAIRDRLRGGFSPKTLREIRKLFAEKPPREVMARSIEAEIRRLRLKNPKTAVFCESIDEANEMAVLLNGEAYHSGVKNPEQVLEDFRGNKVRRVTTIDMFNEGLDVSDLELEIFLRSTSSPIIWEQQLGRGLRRMPGKTRMHVLDFVANIERLAKVRTLSSDIQRHARELGHRDVTEKKVAAGRGGQREGLHIHTPHGDFDFDRIAIDLLARFDAVKRPNAPTATQEYYSLEGAYSVYGVAPKTLNRLVTAMGWELPLRKFGPQTVPAISVAQIEELSRIYPDTFVPRAPKGWGRLKDVARELGVRPSTVERIASENEWELPQHKFRGGVVDNGLNPSQIEELRNHPEVGAVQGQDDRPPVSMAALARELRKAQATLEREAEAMGVSIREHRFGRRKAFGRGVSAEDADALRSTVTPPDETAVSLSALARELRMGPRTLRKIADDEDVSIGEYAFGKTLKAGEGFDARGAAALRAAVRKRNKKTGK